MPAARARPRPTLLLVLGVLSVAGLLVALLLSRRPAPELAVDPNATPLEQDMARWAVLYRQHFEPLVPHVDAIDNLQATRETCNALLVSVMNAQRELPPAPDPDLQGLAADALKHLTTAARGCIRGRTADDEFERDAYLLLGRSSAGALNELLEERYGVAGVAGMGEPTDSAAALRTRQRLP